jgi:hypothetical protein
MYKSLHKYFEEKPSCSENKNHDANNNLNSDNFVMINDFYDTFHKFMLDSSNNKVNVNLGISNTSSHSRKEDHDEKLKLKILDAISEDKILEENKSDILPSQNKINLTNHLQVVQPKLTNIINKKQNYKSDLDDSASYKSDISINTNNNIDLKINTDRNAYSYIKPKNRKRHTKKSKFLNEFHNNNRDLLLLEK